MALAERTSVLERLEDTDRFAQTLLRLRVVAPPAVDVREGEQDPRHPPRRTRLGEELAGLLAELLGLVQLALQLVEVRPRAERLRLGDDAAALLGELDGALEQRRHPVELEPDTKQTGELVGRETLLVLEAAFLGRLESPLPVVLGLLEVGEPPRDVRQHGEHLEASVRIGAVEGFEAAFGKLLRPHHVGVAEKSRLRESDQGQTVRARLAGFLRVARDELHLCLERRQVGRAPSGHRGPVAVTQRRLELGGPDEELAGRPVRLARERPPPR